MRTFFHVTSSENRASIERYGLNWTRMGRMLGVAGSRRPEVDGVFLCRDRQEVEFFCRMDANDGPVDVWAVEGVRESDLVESAEGFVYLPKPISSANLTLLESRRRPEPTADGGDASSAYRSSLTITFGDGPAGRDTEADDGTHRTSPAP